MQQNKFRLKANGTEENDPFLIRFQLQIKEWNEAFSFIKWLQWNQFTDFEIETESNVLETR